MAEVSVNDIQNLDADSRAELMKFIETENARTKVQTSVHVFTDLCFKRCVASGGVTAGALSATESTCLQNCIGRYLDTNIYVVKRVQDMVQRK
ncbi:Tim10/DDP family zinc finger-domain-containing protein [Lipomyces arxii]|uniref:Tim10/DDP family zinc finger-domain-containing protein n=1 Tax=Lipomyces arxii TaxID=56418 RepID=UPI0034CFB03D